MPLTGYQDWQRVDFAAGQIVASLNQAVTANTAINCSNLSAWPFINFAFFAPPGADNYQIAFQWCIDNTYTTTVASDFMTINSDMSWELCIPVLTPYLQVQVNPKAGGNNTVVRMTVYGSLEYAESYNFYLFSTPMILDSSAYGINATKQFFTFNGTPFDAWLNIFCPTAAAADCFIDYFDFGANAYKTYYHVGKPALGVPLITRVPLIAAQARLNIVNGGTAQTITTSLLPVQ